MIYARLRPAVLPTKGEIPLGKRTSPRDNNYPYPYTTTPSHPRNTGLPISQHVLDAGVVLRPHELGNLILRQPLEVGQVLSVSGKIGLAGHDARLHEEDLLACGAGCQLVRVAEVVDVVSHGVVSNHPGVHVDTGGLLKGTFGGLFSNNVSAAAAGETLDEKSQRNLPDGESLQPRWESWETSRIPPWTAQGDKESSAVPG